MEEHIGVVYINVSSLRGSPESSRSGADVRSICVVDAL